MAGREETRAAVDRHTVLATAAFGGLLVLAAVS